MKTISNEQVSVGSSHNHDIDQSNTDKIISFKECKQFYAKFDISDKRISEISNNLIGIVDGVINSYLAEF